MQESSDEAAFCVPVPLKRPPCTSVEGGVPVYDWSSSPFNDEQLLILFSCETPESTQSSNLLSKAIKGLNLWAQNCSGLKVDPV